MKVFLSVGTQLPFDRLLSWVERWASETNAVVDAQVGNQGKNSPFFNCFGMLSEHDFDLMFSSADFIVSHAGMGNIIKAQEIGKPIIVVPRLAELNEHRNNHQIDTANSVKDIPGVFVALSESEFLDATRAVMEFRAPGAVTISREKERILGAVKQFLSS